MSCHGMQHYLKNVRKLDKWRTKQEVAGKKLNKNIFTRHAMSLGNMKFSKDLKLELRDELLLFTIASMEEWLPRSHF